MAKTVLDGRFNLRVRAAEALTDRNLLALLSLKANANDTEFLPVAAHIKHANPRIHVELQKGSGDDFFFYLGQGSKDRYQGRIQLEEERGEIASTLSLETINKYPVIKRDMGKGRRFELGYQDKDQRRFVALSEGGKDAITYWIPTIVNHVLLNIDSFLLDLEKRIEFLKTPECEINSYRLQVADHQSPESHFRNGFTRILYADSSEPIEVNVTGTFVKPDWTKYDLSEVIRTIENKASQISSLHFNRVILPQIAQAGHPVNAIREAYEKSI